MSTELPCEERALDGAAASDRWPSHPFVLLEDRHGGETLCFARCHQVLEAHSYDAVPATLAAMLEAQSAGYFLAGYAAYELGYMFEPRLAPLPSALSGPLLQFGVFDEPRRFDWGEVRGSADISSFSALWTFDAYAARFRQVIDYIRAGDVYQVNLTFPLIGAWSGDPIALFAALRSRQPAPYGGVVSLGSETILSLSPELFFEREGSLIRTRPMKGTAPRGMSPEDDHHFAASLVTSEKNRAENLMIVDLLRNDLGRVSEIGSVRVTDLFSVETYPTLFQMTSGVEAQLRPGLQLPDLLQALFPCGSITGAPKIRAMEVIRELEARPRGVYCGSIGMLNPNGEARFNVAIRTLTLSPSGQATFNVGSGLVFDSEARSEYDECLLKAAFLAECGALRRATLHV
ncbi:Para-aminobenzoate synthase, aminase component [Hyphomicrobiales bacterium]|jgi:aminodeoxychorismate synthase component I|nr:Para-aminobenzoate synthase, aminase component [Hyphomicrobiales bacterium]CAH1702310.1 Para-aminobenzoate synthase, aminase component [Hyphomicrobiales bacterium]CAI0346511.1 Aminodeoxychorismate synthase component I [Hyphomicrobiales bacterium]